MRRGQLTGHARIESRGFEGIPIPTSVAIDHVLVGERLTALTTSTVVVGSSDHLALVAEVAERA